MHSYAPIQLLFPSLFKGETARRTCNFPASSRTPDLCRYVVTRIWLNLSAWLPCCLSELLPKVNKIWTLLTVFSEITFFHWNFLLVVKYFFERQPKSQFRLSGAHIAFWSGYSCRVQQLGICSQLFRPATPDQTYAQRLIAHSHHFIVLTTISPPCRNEAFTKVNWKNKWVTRKTPGSTTSTVAFDKTYVREQSRLQCFHCPEWSCTNSQLDVAFFSILSGRHMLIKQSRPATNHSQPWSPGISAYALIPCTIAVAVIIRRLWIMPIPNYCCPAAFFSHSISPFAKQCVQSEIVQEKEARKQQRRTCREKA